MTRQIPDGQDALADLEALARGPWREEPEFLELLGSLIDEGAPFLEIDTVIAAGTDRTVVRYKLADRLKAFMLARIAADVDGGKIESCGHSVGPVKEDPAALDAMAE